MVNLKAKPFNLDDNDIDWVNKTIEPMTAEEKIGQLFVLRGIRGAIQQGLNLSDLKEIKVFIPSKDFQKNLYTIQDR